MGNLSAAMLTELRKPSPEVYFVLELGDGSGGTLRLSAENVSSVSRGTYQRLVNRYGVLSRKMSDFRTGLQAVQWSADLDNTSGSLGSLTQRYGRNWRGRSAVGILMSPNVEAADYCTFFTGVVDSTQRNDNTLQVQFRGDDDPLETKVTKAPIRENTFPGLPVKGDATGKGVPYVIGTLDSTGIAALGLVPAPYVDGANFRYVVSLGWWANVVRVYVDNVLKTLGATEDYTISQALTADGRKVTLVVFNADQGSGSVVVDLQDVTSPAGPAACLAQVLSDLVYGDYHTETVDGSGHPINTTALTALDTDFLVPLRLDRAFYVPAERISGKDIIKQFCDSFEVHAYWGLDGKLRVRQWDHRTQGDSVYLGPGSPGATEALEEVVTPQIMLSRPKFSQDPESAVNSLLGKAGLRASDGNWLDQRTVFVKTADDKLRSAEIQMPWIPPGSASVASIHYLAPDGTTNNSGWSVTGAGSAHAALAQDPLVPASPAQYVRATASADLRLSMSAMPDLVAVQSVAIWVHLLADGAVASPDDDTFLPYLYIGGVPYNGNTIVGGGAAGSGDGYQTYFGGSWTVNPATSLQFTQSDLNALQVGFGWDPQSTVGKAMRCRLLSVYVTYTASADVSPGHLSVTSRRVNRYRTPPELITLELPLRYMDKDLGDELSIADPREGWDNTPAGRRLTRISGWSVDPNKKSVSHTVEDISRQIKTLWIYGKAGVGVDGASAAGDGMALMTHGAEVAMVRGSRKQMDAPAGEDVQECGPSVQILENCMPSDRYGLLVEPQATNLVIRSVFDAGTTTPTGWTLTSGTAAVSATVGEQLFLDEDVTTQSVVLTGDGGTVTRLTATTTSSITANSTVFVSTARKGSSSTAGDGLFWRLVRNFDGRYWRDSDSTWQVGATDNELPAVTSWTRWDAISKIIDVGADATTLTLSYSLPVAGTVGRTVRIGHAQIEVGTQATSMIPTYASTVARSSDAIRISNDEDTGDFQLVPVDHGCVAFRVRVMFNDADLATSERRYLGRLAFNAGNRFALYYLKGTGWQLEVRSSAVTYTATVQSADRAPLREDIVTVGARWTSNDADVAELGKSPGTWSVVLKDHNGDVTSEDVDVGAPPTFAAAAQFELGYDASTAGREFGGYFEEVRQSPLCFDDEELVS